MAIVLKFEFRIFLYKYIVCMYIVFQYMYEVTTKEQFDA